VRLSGDPLLDDLHQPGLADTRFAAQHHHLSEAFLDLLPAIEDQGDFLLASDQRGQANDRGDLQVTLSAVPEDSVGSEGGRRPLHRLRPQVAADEDAV